MSHLEFFEMKFEGLRFVETPLARRFHEILFIPASNLADLSQAHLFADHTFLL